MRPVKAEMRRESTECDVLIVGAGPVGLTLAIDLAWRGIDVTVVETRARAAPPEPKCNHVAARTMEIFRRLGIAEKVRNAGLPADYPHDISYRTTLHRAGADADQNSLPPRPLHDEGRPRLQLADAGAAASHQPDLSRADPVRACRSQPRIRIINRTAVEDVVVEDDVRRRQPCAISTPAAVQPLSCRF